MTDVSTTWRDRVIGTVGGAIYDYGVEREWLAKRAGRFMWHTDAGLLFDSIRALGELPAGSAILDVPCGGGVALRGLRVGQDVRYVAADISVSMLARARRQAERLGLRSVEFVEANIERMPFEDNEFDVCVCFNGLHCLPDPAAAVREIARCLAPGGRLIGDSVVRGAGRRAELFVTVFRRSNLFGDSGTADDLERWLSEAGLRVDRLERSGAVAHFTATRAVTSP